jgi:hypothetical protein
MSSKGSPITGDGVGVGDVEARIRRVGERLTGSFRRILAELPDGPHRPNQLARLLGLNRDISGRILSATASADPVTAIHVIPGPDPLRKLLKAARRRNVAAQVLEEAEDAVDAFERLTRSVAGDRPALDAIISSMIPDARARFELNAKQIMFKGASLLKGAMADLWLHAALVHPAADDPESYDVAHIYGTLGMRRLRPGVGVKFTYRQFGTPSTTCRMLDGGTPEQSDGRELDGFCMLPSAPLAVTQVNQGAILALGGDGVGPGSATDKLLVEVRPRAMARRRAAAARHRKSLFVAPSIPVKVLAFDMLLHDDAYPGAEPTLVLYDTAVEGMASVNDPTRDADRLDVHESIMVLGRGPNRLVQREMPRYVPMLQHVCEKLGWDLARFRGYRCQIQYPMHGLQVCMAFDAPGTEVRTED